MTKIYSLKDPINLEIRYIGKTIQSLKKRLSGHITWAKYQPNKSHVSNWIRSLLKVGKIPIIELIEDVQDELWEEREKYWISFYGDKLCNHSIGGDRGSLGYKCTEEHKSKISKALTGRKRSLEDCKKISEGQKGKIISKEQREKLRQLNLGKTQSLETRLKKSKYPVLQIDPITEEVIAEFPTLGIAQEKTGCLKGNIVSVISGRLKTYKGYKWRYKN